MDADTERAIDEARQKLDALWQTMTVEDFRRVHAKFFGCILSVETGFKRRFPAEWAAYEKDFYGEDA
jgi:hypothetical protein